jgi:hypothetical protein
VREAREGPVTSEGPAQPAGAMARPGSASARGAKAVAPPRPSTMLSFESLFAQAQWLKTWFGEDRAWLAMPLLMQGEDDEIRERVRTVAAATGLRIAAVGDVLMATRAAKPLQDMLTATRLQRPISECGHALSPMPRRTCGHVPACRRSTSQSGWPKPSRSPAAACFR